jgi:UDP-3-O-[3-hydroxymyristoyl] glucosamine N-acyltransferase
VTFGGQVGVGGHLTIGDGVKAVGQSGITNSVAPGAFISGYPAIDNMEWRKASAVFRRLPELRKRLRELERRLEAMDKA